MEIKKLLSELPPAPEDVPDWIKRECVKNTYLFYSRKKRKATCSRCGAEYVLDEEGYCDELDEYMEHDKKMECMACLRTAIAKSENISRGKLEEKFRVLLFVKKGNSLYGTLTHVWIDFKDSNSPNITRDISAFYKFNKREQIYLKHDIGNCYTSERWADYSRNIKCPNPPMYMGWMTAVFEKTYIYQKNWPSVFNVPVLEYADVAKVYQEFDASEYGLIHYINLAIKFPSLELLRKAGFAKLVEDKVMDGTPSRACNWRGKSLEKILRCTRAQMKEIRAEEFNLRELLAFQYYNKHGSSCPAHLITILIDLYQHGREKREEILKKHIDIANAANYVHEQKLKYTDKYITINDYADYLDECEKLGYNLTEKRTLKPKDLIIAHQRTSERVREIKEQIDEETFRKNILKITKMEDPYIAGTYLIIPAASAAELRKEGESLGHCVGGYAHKIISGTSAILFIRERKNPKKSFYTLELRSNGEISQCRGESNRSVTPEVQQFIEQWHNEIIKNKKKSKVA